MRRLIAATAAGSLAVAAALFGALPASAADPAEVYVVHGIPGLPVDVYVNGALTLDDFQPETVAGPLDLPAGSYEIAITAADAADASAPVLTATADVAAGNSYSLVAHLDADGNPTVTPYANDISTISAGQTRLVSIFRISIRCQPQCCIAATTGGLRLTLRLATAVPVRSPAKPGDIRPASP